MSDSDISPTTTEAQPYTNGNPVPIDVVLKVDAPEQVQPGSWPYPLIVEVAWRDPVITHGSPIICFCEGFKYGSEDVLFKKDGQEIDAISFDELKAVVKKRDPKKTDAEIKKIFETLDFDDNKKITFDEFLIFDFALDAYGYDYSNAIII
ncbi:uncharacterized protein BHQ10_001171 [Talaromyces amestolkiae]|uniref:EF-hand domain-containing protein n=1 Tax=Talaromyces amestolkiae TaxID=1196081 RepID=A0A364KNP8_TALAM|nr:uncharacterized protein BHQ10_001171 [Talaromyces amestolkiae]RAO65159.1 hypothetical protein BHQ10_001171 [Talaromyces amestolkiae]